MKTLKIPKSHVGVSKTLRLPQNIVEDIESLAKIKNTSLNQISILLMEFALENLDDEDKKLLQKYKKNN